MRVALVLGLCACSGRSAPAGDAAIVGDSAIDASAPQPPASLTRWLVGNPADAVTTSRPGIILMGGGVDVDAAFAWQRDRIGGGDVVVIRTTGADGYNDYLFSEIGGADSVETMIVSSRALAFDPYVSWTLEHAEAIFLAGGDQATYVAAWDDSPVADKIAQAFSRGAVIGGTSAGCAFLAGIVYSASAGTVLSDEALSNPYDARVTLVRDVTTLPAMAGVITDTHFGARDRMGRLLAFAARAMADGWSSSPVALGIDERTALVVDEAGTGRVLGAGAVYAITPAAPPTRCAANQTLDWRDVPLHELRVGDAISLPAGTTAGSPRTLSSVDGLLEPANPY